MPQLAPDGKQAEGSTRARSLGALFLMVALSIAPTAGAATIGSGKPADETRAVGAFSAISLHGDIDLVVHQAGNESVRVHADDNILPLVQTIVETRGAMRSLRIQYKPGESLRSRTKVVVTVDVQKLNALSSAGSGDIRVDAIKTPALALGVSGSSNAWLRQLDTEQLDVNITGSGNVQVAGRAVKLDISIAGSGNLRAQDLSADAVSVSIAGSGDVKVTAQKAISVAVAGSGSVEYGGDAALAQQSVVGSGLGRVNTTKPISDEHEVDEADEQGIQLLEAREDASVALQAPE